MDVSDILASQAQVLRHHRPERDRQRKLRPRSRSVSPVDRTGWNPAPTRSAVQPVDPPLARGSARATPAANNAAPARQAPPQAQTSPTKWQRFARAKGISSQRRDKKIWDDERQAWVSRWGWKGKNRDGETQWLHEVLANADADYDPPKEARVARKERMAKNERQRLQNVARAQQGPMTTTTTTGTQVDHKRYIDRTLATTRTSAASMGKFDRALDGKKKLRGFDPIEKSVDAEKNANMALIKQIGNGASGSSSEKSKRDGGGGAGDVVNVRKEMRFASGRQGAAALVRKSGSGHKN
ncbi:ribosome biogenesis regulatory protein-domain-containing protein [Lactarius indigo]|nr:ribosome biogenesis regulatory protein-domain-containing protein [Lactarius indigo]